MSDRYRDVDCGMGNRAWEMKLLFCVVKARTLQKYHSVDCIDKKTTLIILEKNIQEKFGDIFEMVWTLVYRAFIYVFGYLVISGNTMRRRSGYYWVLFFFSFLLLRLLVLQSLVNLSIFHNCPPLFSVLYLTSPVPKAHILQIFLS
jgi:hypothetical protein